MTVEPWLSTTKTANQIGVTAKFLRENRLSLFKPGRHYKLKNPNAHRPTYLWHAERCDQVLKKATKQAAVLESNQKTVAKGRGVQLPFLPEVEAYDIE
ncbi:MAG: hypothetical protein AAFR12_05355 [Cyanobacteria bacterium J06626_6]